MGLSKLFAPTQEGDTSKSSTMTNKYFVSIHKTAFETIPWKRQESEQGFPPNFDLVMGSPWFHVHPKVLTTSPSKWWKHQGAVEKKSWCKLLMDGRILDWAHAAKWAPRKFHFSCLQWELIWEHISLAFIGIQLGRWIETALVWRHPHCIAISINSNIQALYGIILIVYNLNLNLYTVLQLFNYIAICRKYIYIYMEILPKIFLQDSQCHQGSLEGSSLSPPGWL